MIKNCKICSKEFSFRKSRILVAKFCSRKCKCIAQRGLPTWNKGLKGAQNGWNNGLNMRELYPQCGFRKGSDNPSWNGGITRKSNEKQFKCQDCFIGIKKRKTARCQRCSGARVLEKLREKYPNGHWLGKKRVCTWPTDTQKGKNHWHWKGGITPFRTKIYFSKEYKDWRKAVFERDGYRCLACGKRRGDEGITKLNLNADHIYPFSKFPRLRLMLENGRTLCENCHRKYGWQWWRESTL